MVTTPGSGRGRPLQVLTREALNGYGHAEPALWIATAAHRPIAERARVGAHSGTQDFPQILARPDVSEQDQPAPLLDRAHLDAQTFGDADLAREVLSLFEDQCRRLLPPLLDEARPVGERADLAHTIKGAALGVGAMQVARASAAVETDLRTGEPASGTGGKTGLATLRTAVAETLAALGGLGLEA